MPDIHKVQDFKGQRLTRLKSKRVPQNWLLLDTETYSADINGIECQRFSIGWTCFVTDITDLNKKNVIWKFWESEEELNIYIEKITAGYKNVILCGHNIFFDLQASGFFYYFTKWKWQLDFIYDKGLTYILRCEKDKNKLSIVSTTNWFDCSLKKLGELIGVEKIDIDLKKAGFEELKRYCRQDVLILLRGIEYYINFLRVNDLGRLSLTKSSQAFSTYRYGFMKNKIVVHKDDMVKQMERDAYHGGRCECFQIGKMKGKEFLSLDVNSMYPFVMQKFDYPNELIEYTENIDSSKLADVLEKFAVIAEVEIDTDEPVFSYRKYKKTFFPVGSFSVTLCTEGLKYAIKRGYIKEIKRAAIYNKADLFSDYVKFFTDLKGKYTNDNNQVMRQLTKYMLNSLYGKFGQKKIVREEIVDPTGREYSKEEIINIDNSEVTIIIRLMNKMIIQHDEQENENSFPVIAAHITENARLHLWDIIKSVGRDRVLYCDTDSVKIEANDLQHVDYEIDNTKLGALKIEKRSSELIIEGAKNYRTETERYIKGIPKKAIEVRPGVFEYTRFERQNKHLTDKQISGVQVKPAVRILQQRYDKGEVLANGRVIPFRLESSRFPALPLQQPDAYLPF